MPKNTVVILCPWAVNTSTQTWGADAHEFKPERWLDADGKSNNKGGAESNFAFLTFLHGPRSCMFPRFMQKGSVTLTFARHLLTIEPVCI